MDEPVLKSANIVFHLPQGDDKDDDTKVSVNVTSKFNDDFDLQVAWRRDFAEGTWEDTGDKYYAYELSVAGGLRLSQLDRDVRTRIEIHPNGNDTVKFDYKLTLVFDDNNPTTAAVNLVQDRNGIVLSQDNKIYFSR